jgi:V/A-type H+-transporting ATPase subunit I
MMRPAPARWFEVVCARQDVSLLLEALGASGAVELETAAGVAMTAEWAELAPGLAEFHGWQARYGEFWPPAGAAGAACPETPLRTLQRALAAVQSWGRACEPDIVALQVLAHERAELELWRAALCAWQAQTATAPTAAGGERLIGTWLVDPGSSAVDPSAHGLARELTLDDGRRVWMLLAERSAIVELRAAVAAGHGLLLPCPSWLPPHLIGADAAGAAKLIQIEGQVRQHRQRLADVATQTGLPQALAELQRLDWITHSVRALRTSELLAFVTGWTSDPSGGAIAHAVADCGARALVHFPPTPPELTPPLLLSNPRWARPFELFSRAFGVPGRFEADPTPVVAVVAPLLFGYMFGDVGQGAVIAAVGLWVQRRHTFGRLMISAGLASMLFGWVYGSVFALENVIAPLWLHPLQHPLVVLAVPLVGGALLLLLGLALNGLGAWWRGSFPEWLRRDAGGIVVYLGLLLAAFERAGLWLAAAGVIWTVLAQLAHQRALLQLAAALGELLERTLQLLVNTLSFARVGAFALAHAGLSSAVVALADAAGHGLGALLVLIVGNVVMLILEAMVVSIQTTRLVLFEFFTRFLTGAGRMFTPLPPPPSIRSTR